MASSTEKTVGDGDNIFKEASIVRDVSPVENTTGGGESRVNTELPLLKSKRKANDAGKAIGKGTNNMLELLEKINIKVTEEYNGFGDMAVGLRVFVEQLKTKTSSFDEYVHQHRLLEYPHRYRPGTVALREIRKYEKSTEFLIRKRVTIILV